MRKSLDGGVFHAMRAFVCVVDSGSFSQAAAQLELTTAQVSRLVSELEKRLRAKLLHRTTRQRVLTDVGAAYLERCREILGLLTDAEAQASGNSLMPSGTLRLQCTPNFGQRYVSPLLPEFLWRYPSIRIEYSTSPCIQNVLAPGIDVSLHLAEGAHDCGPASRRLGTTFLVLCASPGYLSRHPRPQTPADLSKHVCLQTAAPPVGPKWTLVAGEGREHELVPEGPCISDTPDVLRDAAEAGVGIALLPLFSVADAVAAGRLVRVLAPWRSPDISVFALTPARRYPDAKTSAWLGFLDEHVAPAIERDVRFFDDG